MSTFVGTRRRVLAISTSLAVVLALVPALPAIALTSEACPTTLPLGGFTDLTGLSDDAKDAIDCVAYYGVSKGTSPTTFDPNNDVLRWQMALFLTRTVTGLGTTLPNGGSQGFTDIGTLDAATQTAINQLKQLGITQGTSGTTFTPNGTVPRWQMALFLTRLLTKVGIALPNGVSQGFTDIVTLDAATQTAINQLRQLGVALGTSTTTFNPNGNVARWQMALFLARSLDTGGGSPYKITITTPAPAAQITEIVTVTVNVKKADGTNASGVRVDLFVASSLDSNGKCVVDTDAKFGAGDGGTGTNCTIDTGDPQTNAQGVATINITHTTVTEKDTIYGWAGETGEVFDLEDVRGEFKYDLTWVPVVASLDLPADTVVKYGTTGSVKAQFNDANGKPVLLQGQTVRFVVSRGGNNLLSANVVSAADGSATLSYVGPSDPTGGNDGTTVDTVTAFWDKDLDLIDDGNSEPGDTGTATWDDDLPLNTQATLSQTNVSSLVSTNTTVNATVVNKFGQPITNAEVNFQTGSGPSGSANTNASGVASFQYVGPAADQADTIDIQVDLNGAVIEPGDIDFGSVTMVHYWVEAPAASIGPGQTEFDVLAVDLSNNTIDVKQIGAANYYRLSYDSNGDNFDVNGGADETLAQFETALSGLELPNLDGAGPLELVTNPYSVPSNTASFFILNT